MKSDVRKPVRVAAVLAIAATVLSCGDKKSTPTSPTNSTPATPVTSVALQIIGAPTASVGIGQAFDLRALDVRSDGSSIPLVSAVSWTSSSPDVASVSTSGSVISRTTGSTVVSASYLTRTASATIRVVDNWADLDFRVAILNSSPTPKSVSDVQRVFGIASDLLLERTGSRMRIIDMRDVENDVPLSVTRAYMDSLTSEAPDGVIVWTQDTTAVTYGAYSQTVARPAPYSNRFPASAGSNRLYMSAIHYEHMFARCGYDSTGGIRISDRSGGGECRNQSGLVCVNNGRFWECPFASSDRYGNPDIYLASTIVHEFMHPVGSAGNNDHYGTATCVARVHMSGSDAANTARGEWYCEQCPDLFLLFRPVGAPSAMRIR